MKHFELRFLDKLDVVILMRAYIGGDDLAALSEAEKLSLTHTIEIWEGARKVARVQKGNRTLAHTDRVCG
jgi:hypothetical protein